MAIVPVSKIACQRLAATRDWLADGLPLSLSTATTFLAGLPSLGVRPSPSGDMADVTDEAEIWARMRAIYDGFLAGNSDRVDALLQRDVTIWDSAEFPLARGLDQLREMRSRRPRASEAPTVIQLDARDPVIDVWDDTALVRHVLVVELSDGTRQTVRNTSVWRRAEAGWLAVHNHEDVAGGGAKP